MAPADQRRRGSMEPGEIVYLVVVQMVKLHDRIPFPGA
jgi:hypothetical protein